MNAATILKILNAADALLNSAQSLGLAREQAEKMLNAAHAEGRDITTEEVQAELDKLQSELDDTQDMIDNM